MNKNENFNRKPTIDIIEICKDMESLLDYEDESKYIEEKNARSAYNYIHNVKVYNIISRTISKKPMYNSKKNMRH